MRVFALPARPAPVDIDLDSTAVIVVDMQNDFGSPGGMFDRAGIDISPIRAIMPAIAEVLSDARAAKLPIIYLKQQHAADLSDLGPADAPHVIKHQPLQLGRAVNAPDGSTGRILIADTWNTAIAEGLKPEADDIIVPKRRYSGFFETDLHDRLQTSGVKTLIFTGATTSVCVEATLRDAMYRDYTCVILANCTAEPIAHGAARSNHEASLLTIELLLGWVAQSADLHTALAGVGGDATVAAA